MSSSFLVFSWRVWPTGIAQSAIFLRCTSGEINDSPSRPARRETRI